MIQSFGVQSKQPQNCHDDINADICSFSLINPVVDVT